MRRCDICNRLDDGLVKIQDDLREDGLHDICRECERMISDSIHAGLARLNALRAKVKQNIWRRCVAAIRGER